MHWHWYRVSAYSNTQDLGAQRSQVENFGCILSAQASCNTGWGIGSLLLDGIKGTAWLSYITLLFSLGWLQHGVVRSMVLPHEEYSLTFIYQPLVLWGLHSRAWWDTVSCHRAACASCWVLHAAYPRPVLVPLMLLLLRRAEKLRLSLKIYMFYLLWMGKMWGWIRRKDTW